MRSLPVVLLLCAVPLLAACRQCSDPTPWPALAGQPLGARCRAAGDCAARLDCLDSTCTVPCPDGLCAVGRCFDGRSCLPGCARDEDCLMGTTAGRCAGLSLASGLTWSETCSTGTCVR